MVEVLITSSALIAGLLLLRGLFRKTLSRRVQYALWGLVALRLLVPLELPGADFSLLSSVDPVRTAVEERLGAESVRPSAPTGGLSSFSPLPGAGGPVSSSPSSPSAASSSSVSSPLTAAEVLRLVWLAGVGVMALFFLGANLRFWLRLRRTRKPYPVEGCGRRVYLVEEGLASPCLFGLLRPAIYLNPTAISSPARLRHVLAHEETHARHLDPIWSLARCACLAVYWFDPLVWAAALAVRTDCELACDEGTLVRLGEEERISYGETLLSLVPVKRVPANPMLTATTMTAGKKLLLDRLNRIVQRPRCLAAVTAAVLVLAGALAACTFAGPGGEEEPPTPPEETNTPPVVSLGPSQPVESADPEETPEALPPELASAVLSDASNPEGEGVKYYCFEYGSFFEYPIEADFLSAFGFEGADPFYEYVQEEEWNCWEDESNSFKTLDVTHRTSLYYNMEAGVGCVVRDYFYEGQPHKTGLVFEGMEQAADDEWGWWSRWEMDWFSPPEELRHWGEDYQEHYEYDEDGRVVFFETDAIHEAPGTDGTERVGLCSADFTYDENGVLRYRSFGKAFWMDSYQMNQRSWFDELGRVCYENCYVTHGEEEFFYIYTDDGPAPAYCLYIDEWGNGVHLGKY